jgi:hypothetical protein
MRPRDRLIEAAQAMVDELTILLCSLPRTRIPGEDHGSNGCASCFPACESSGTKTCSAASRRQRRLLEVWRKIVANAHPEPIDYVFAASIMAVTGASGRRLSSCRLAPASWATTSGGLGGLSATKVRDDPWNYWDLPAAPVRDHYALTICLHGVEASAKSTLAERWPSITDYRCSPNMAGLHCETHGTDCREQDLLLIGEAQQAMIEAGAAVVQSAADRGHRCVDDRGMVSDDDRLLPDQLICHRKRSVPRARHRRPLHRRRHARLW